MKADEVIRKESEDFNRHDAAAFTANYAPEAIVHDPQYPEPLRGSAAIKKDVADFFAAFPDIRGSVVGTVVSGDAYAVEWSMRGTHRGPLLGPSGEIPATNKTVEMNAAAFGRLDKEGRIVKERRYYDLAGLMAQLGVMQ